jgi:hypothetical protein
LWSWGGFLVCLLIVVVVMGGCAAPSSTTGARTSTGFVATQTAQSYAVTLSVSPAKFGTNTFVVTLRTARGEAVSGADVRLATQMLDMDMGVQTAQLQPTSTPGIYPGQWDLTMSGHWQVLVNIVPPGDVMLQPFVFRLSASY